MIDALPITFFADFTCPFCYLTEVGLARIGERRPLELRPRSFELYPGPEPLPNPGHDPAELASASTLADELGIELRTPEMRPRTRKAHEAWRFAEALGRGPEMREAIYVAYWNGGADIGRIDVLSGVARSLGVDATDLKIALDIDSHGEAVTRDLMLARRLNVRQVPALFVGSGPGAGILLGARSLEALDEALARG